MIEVELVGGRELLAKLRALPREVNKGMLSAIRDGGNLIANRARVNSSFSTRIPAAIKVRVSGVAAQPGVRIYVDRRKAPHARALELGNVGSRSDMLRHPVPNAKTWAEQPRRPFLFPAAYEMRKPTLARIRRGLRDALAK